jgi:hypothetical protein
VFVKLHGLLAPVHLYTFGDVSLPTGGRGEAPAHTRGLATPRACVNARTEWTLPDERTAGYLLRPNSLTAARRAPLG